MRDYNHLNRVKETKFPWQAGLLKKNMSPRAFANPLTSFILFKAEEILTNAVIQINRVRVYFRPSEQLETGLEKIKANTSVYTVAPFTDMPIVATVLYFLPLSDLLTGHVVYHFVYKNVDYEVNTTGLTEMLQIDLPDQSTENILITVTNNTNSTLYVFRQPNQISPLLLIGVGESVDVLYKLYTINPTDYTDYLGVGEIVNGVE